MAGSERILIAGLFTNPEKEPVTQAVELARLLKKKHYRILTVSRFRNRLLRILDIVAYILLNRRNFDIAIVQFYSGNSLIWQHIACTLVKWFNKKLVITIHGGAVPERMKRHPQRYLRVLNKADIITCPSEFIIERLKDYGIRPLLIENIIDLQQYPFFEKDTLRPVLLWMRAFSPIYNPEMAVNVVRELKEIYPEIKMFMGGPDLGMLAKVKNLIKEYDLQEHITLTGFLDSAKKREYAKQADIYISTNTIDNAPVTFLEMWAMGLPVISTNVGGVSYLVRDGETGLLTNSDDHSAMARKVAELLSPSDVAGKLVRNGREKVKSYGEDAVFNKWQALLNTLSTGA